MSMLRTSTGQIRMWIVVLVSALVALLGMIPGLGLPGLLFMYPGVWLFEGIGSYVGVTSFSELPGDAVWAIAISMTLSLCPFLIVAYICAFRLVRDSKKKQWLTWLALCLLWSVAGTAIFTRSINVEQYDINSQLQQILEGAGA